jgi:hypothetical protein
MFMALGLECPDINKLRIGYGALICDPSVSDFVRLLFTYVNRIDCSAKEWYVSVLADQPRANIYSTEKFRPNPMAARLKAWVCRRSFAGIVRANPTLGMDVSLFWVLSVVKVEAFASDGSSFESPTRICCGWVSAWSLEWCPGLKWGFDPLGGWRIKTVWVCCRVGTLGA